MRASSAQCAVWAKRSIARNIRAPFHCVSKEYGMVLDLTHGEAIRSGCLACMNKSAVVTILVFDDGDDDV